MDWPSAVEFTNEGVRQRPMLAGFKSVYLEQNPGNKLRKSASKFSEKEKNDIHLRRIEKVTNKNASTLKQHDGTLQRWNDNIETAQAMCAEKLDRSTNDQLKSAIEQNQGENESITFDSAKNVFFYSNEGQTAKFKVIQGSNGKHLLQITISGRLSKQELENRIEEIVATLGRCCNTAVQENDGNRTLNLNGTVIILPSKTDKTKPRASFKVEHNKIHFQGDSYKDDMASVFGQDTIPVNVNEGFPIKEMSNEAWRNDCMRQVKSMISPMVELDEQYGKFLDGKKIKAPVNCLFELLSMNMMLNSVLGSQSNQHEEIFKIAGSLSLAIKQDTGAVSIGSSVLTETTEDSFESWKTTLESIRDAYLRFTERITNLKNSTTFIAGEAVLRQHEALLRELFIEATKRASDVLQLDNGAIKNKMSQLRYDMEFSSASQVMTDVITMFDEQHDQQQQELELKKKEQERTEKEEKSQQEIAGLCKKVQNLTEEVKQRDNGLEKLQKTIEERDNQIKDLKRQIDALTDAVDEQNAEFRNLKDTIWQQSDKINALNQTIVKNAEESQKKISNLEEEIRKLDETLNERNDEINKLTKKIEDLEEQIKELEKKSVQLTADGDSSATMFNPVNSMNGVGYYGMQPVGDDMKAKLEKLEKLCEEQKRQLEEQQKEIERLKNELERLKDEHRVEIDDKETALDNANSRVKQLENDIRELHSQIGSLKELDIKINESRTKVQQTILDNKPAPVEASTVTRKQRNFGFRFAGSNEQKKDE